MNPSLRQLELSFEAPAIRPGRVHHRSRRLARAGWWFAQMHAVVDRALDWPVAPAPHPRQPSLELAGVR